MTAPTSSSPACNTTSDLPAASSEDFGHRTTVSGGLSVCAVRIDRLSARYNSAGAAPAWRESPEPQAVSDAGNFRRSWPVRIVAIPSRLAKRDGEPDRYIADGPPGQRAPLRRPDGCPQRPGYRCPGPRPGRPLPVVPAGAKSRRPDCRDRRGHARVRSGEDHGERAVLHGGQCGCSACMTPR